MTVHRHRPMERETRAAVQFKNTNSKNDVKHIFKKLYTCTFINGIRSQGEKKNNLTSANVVVTVNIKRTMSSTCRILLSSRGGSQLLPGLRQLEPADNFRQIAGVK